MTIDPLRLDRRSLLGAAGALLASCAVKPQDPSAIAAARSIRTSELRIRDPYILPDRRSYAYRLFAQTGNRDPQRQRHGVEVYRSSDLRSWSAPEVVYVPPPGHWAGEEVWAPEVHAIDGAYYLFVTLNDPANAGRATIIARSRSPDGPFEQISQQSRTPAGEVALDGTPFVSASGERWMIYCHEWVQIGDGAVKALPMAPDWSRPLGEPALLFHGSEAPWSTRHTARLSTGQVLDGHVTDGPAVTRVPGGSLLMLWSSFHKGEYAIGLARSENGRITGPWTHEAEPVLVGGGHPSLFTRHDGRLMAAFHSPNFGERERLVVHQVVRRGDLLSLSPAEE